MVNVNEDTIVAIATPPGKGGIGVIRISGLAAGQISYVLTHKQLEPRYAHFCKFYNKHEEVLDNGIAIFFPGPQSFTGEDVVEIQGHGGPVVLDRLLKAVVECGARLAKPGEFSERAFLNNKIDLAQAEAIADLIDAQSESAARSALRSLQGDFSEHIKQLLQMIIHLRTYVEAAIDFPEEEIDFLAVDRVRNELQEIIDKLDKVLLTARQGSILREGMTVVIAGKPNAGKSSLLNRLCGKETAIVTEIAGTTRDVLKETIQLDGLPLKIIDTAGLRQSNDAIEQEGVKRAWQELDRADAIILVVDVNKAEKDIQKMHPEIFMLNKPLIIVKNKIDTQGLHAERIRAKEGSAYFTEIYLSAKKNQGIELLIQALKDTVGYVENSEDDFIARRRHLDALERAKQYMVNGQVQLKEHRAGELLAEDLLLAQHALNEITGEFTSDDLLGEIFSHFCIGK